MKISPTLFSFICVFIIFILTGCQVHNIRDMDVDSYLERDSSSSVMGQHDKAISDYSRAILINPEHADNYYYRGNAYVAKGQYDKAISDYNKSIEINPMNAEAYYYRGLAYFSKGNNYRAISNLKKAGKMNPELAEECQSTIKLINMMSVFENIRSIGAGTSFQLP